jgi:ceramide synthetase
LSIKYKDPSNVEDFSLGKIYTKKLCQNFYKVFFYIANVYFGYNVLKDVEFFPTWLGGKGDFANLYKDEKMNIFFDKPAYFNLYYMIYLSHNLTDLVYLLFIYEKQTDFPLMFLHHSCTISLIVFSYLTNHSNFGVIVMFIHDIADILVYYMRSVINTDVPEFIKITGGVKLLIVYIYTRIFVFGKLLYSCYVEKHDWDIAFTTLWVFLDFLFTIHLYWLFQILKKLYNALFKKEISDTASFRKQLDNKKF